MIVEWKQVELHEPDYGHMVLVWIAGVGIEVDIWLGRFENHGCRDITHWMYWPSPPRY